MATPLNILIAEDSPADAELMMAQLRHDGYDPQWRRVETEADFLAELKKTPDIVLSDYAMPQFSGLRAAQLTQESGLNIPFILISGTVGEDAAVEAMKCGATDYLLKDRIIRLGSAVQRALEQKRLRDEHKRAEEALRRSREEFKDLFDNAPVGFHEIDTAGRIVRVNDTELKMLGYTAEELLGQFVWKISADEEVSRRAALAKLAGEAMPSSEGFERVLRRKDGSTFPVLIKDRLLESKDGSITGVRAAIQDITDRKKADDELRWKTAFLEALVDAALDGVLVVNNQGKKILQNQRLNELWKIPPQIAENPNDAEQVQFVTNQTKNPGEFVARIVYLYSHPEEVSREEIELIDGTVLDRYSSPIRDKAGQYYGRIWTFRDITEHRKLEEQFRQSQKMESIGRLAGGVAHDFNNILAVIQMQADLLKTDEDVAPAQLELANGIANAAQRAANLTRQLLMFSRKQTLQLRDLNLNEAVNDIAGILKRTLGENFELQFKFEVRPMFVHADQGMMDQVLLNLAVNARDAMPNGGQLVIETFAVDFDETVCAKSPQARPGAFVCLSVSDTGSGIPAEILPHIFEPFFTTKEVGKGTGLGLATVHGIVQQHQGWINVYSEAGRGTTFRIYLPRLAGHNGQPPEPSDLTAVRGGNETILMVEDEEFLRESAGKVLSQLGYHVLEAANGNEALALWSERRDEIRLLLTDLVMPGGMTGMELGGRLMKEEPGLKVIYTSGYSAEIAGKDFPLQEGVDFLTKPFAARKLALTVRNSLDNGG